MIKLQTKLIDESTGKQINVGDRVWIWHNKQPVNCYFHSFSFTDDYYFEFDLGGPDADHPDEPNIVTQNNSVISLSRRELILNALTEIHARINHCRATIYAIESGTYAVRKELRWDVETEDDDGNPRELTDADYNFTYYDPKEAEIRGYYSVYDRPEIQKARLEEHIKEECRLYELLNQKEYEQLPTVQDILRAISGDMFRADLITDNQLYNHLLPQIEKTQIVNRNW